MQIKYLSLTLLLALASLPAMAQALKCDAPLYSTAYPQVPRVSKLTTIDPNAKLLEINSFPNWSTPIITYDQASKTEDVAVLDKSDTATGTGGAANIDLISTWRKKTISIYSYFSAPTVRGDAFDALTVVVKDKAYALPRISALRSAFEITPELATAMMSAQGNLKILAGTSNEVFTDVTTWEIGAQTVAAWKKIQTMQPACP